VNRLEERLGNGRPGLAPYVTAGDWGLDTTLAVLRGLDEAGATCVELGVPFSDPVADGPVLQAAARRALEAGTTLDGVLSVVASFRGGGPEAAGSDLPVAIFSYANPLLRRGWRRSCELIAAAGADALLVPDVPVEESGPMREAALAFGLCPIFFVAPTTTDERLRAAAEASRGFLYVIGRCGVTGTHTRLDRAATEFLSRVRGAVDLPLAIGFGLSTSQQVRVVTRHAQLAVVGSALVERIHQAVVRGGTAEAGPTATRFVAGLRAAACSQDGSSHA
jgi:tryptophan synthase alpha chain